MMIRIADFFNKYLAVVNKKEFKFECTYLWASLLVNSIALVLGSFALFLTVTMFIAVLYENLRYLGIDWAEPLREINIYFTSAHKPKLEVIIGSNLCFLVVVGIYAFWAYEKKIFAFFDRMVDKVLNRFCRRLPESQE